MISRLNKNGHFYFKLIFTFIIIFNFKRYILYKFTKFDFGSSIYFNRHFHSHDVGGHNIYAHTYV